VPAVTDLVFAASLTFLHISSSLLHVQLWWQMGSTASGKPRVMRESVTLWHC